MGDTVFVIPLSMELTKKYGSSLSYENRVKLISESFDINNGITILNMVGEGLFSINLAKSIIEYKKIQPGQIKLIFGIETIDNFKDFEVEITYLGFCNWFNFYKKLQQQNIDWKNLKIDKHLVALSNRPSTFRAYYIKNILDLFGDKALVSFDLIGKSTPHIKKILHPYKVPIVIDCDVENLSYTISKRHNPPGTKILKSLFNVVLETNEPKNSEIFITEKSFKPFAWHQLPIIVSSLGHANHLRKLGFDMFDDILDNHKYNEKNFNNYEIKIFSLINNLIKRYPSIEDIEILRENVWPRLEYNNQLLNKFVESDTYDWSKFQ